MTRGFILLGLVVLLAGGARGQSAAQPAGVANVWQNYDWLKPTAAQQGQLASYANYGDFIDMALPGTSVIYSGGQAWMVQGTSVSTAYATGVAAGTKTSNCDGWPQIQTAMQQKFVVPAK